MTPEYRRDTVVCLLMATAIVTGVISYRTGEEMPKPPPQAAAPSRTLAKFVPPPAPAGAGMVLRDEMRKALDEEGDAPLQKRLDLLAGITGEPNPPECRALLDALLKPCPANAPEGWHAEYLHNIAGLLQSSAGMREPFARALGTLARDSKRDATVRDYALQHLRLVWERADGTLRTEVEGTLRALATDPALQSSALLSLHLLGGAGGLGEVAPSSKSIGGKGRVADADLVPFVDSILAESPSPGNITARLTALRIAGERRLSGCRESLRRVAAGESEHTLTRMAAIANLGLIADPADRTFLESINGNGDGRIANAVRKALAATAP